ncbi:MAG: FAD-binding oxidoreductase [Burkholderiales bacterium]|nr:FAD-binding oxidoreductase [Burkholderiales bacterium]
MVDTGADVLVVGAGIVGTACALALQSEGLQVALLDATQPGGGVTAAGMGHLVALDESEQELDLCLLSLRLWQEFMDEHPGIGEVSRCGTLWVAENEQQLAAAQQRAARLSARGWQAEAVSGDRLPRLEPALRRGLAGGVRVGGDSVVYPPAVAHFLAQELVRRGGRLECGRRVVALHAGGLTLADGGRRSAPQIVLATGVDIAQLLPEVGVFGRKGHLAITDRYPGSLQHQVVGMDYGQAAVSADALAVAANVQPRPSGQWLIGSCRQDGQTDGALDPRALSAVLQAAIRLLPALGGMRIIRAWAGMRPASSDGQPLLGPHPGRAGIWLAAGHEGLGVTTAFASARLLADQMLGRNSEIDRNPYLPGRLPALRNPIYA